MNSSKRVKLSLRVIKEKKTLDSNPNVSDCIENEITKHEFEGLERSLKTINDKLNQSSSSDNQRNSEIISCASRNTGQRLTTWTPLPDLQWSDNPVQMVKANSENQTRKTDSFRSQVPKSEWIPLPMPCLHCLCSHLLSSKFIQKASEQNDSTLIKTSKHDSKNDTRKVDSTLPDVLSIPETLLSVNTNCVAVCTSSVSCNTKSQANILQTSVSHLPVRRESEVDSRLGPGTEHSKKFAFHGADQRPHPHDSRILQKAHSQVSTRPVFIPKVKSSLMMCQSSTTNIQISTSVSTPSGKLHMTTNKVSSHSVPKPSMSIPKPPGWNSNFIKNDDSSPLEHRGLGSDVSTSNTHETPCAKGQESNSTLSLQQCPLCAVQFENSLGQIERDSHIAACLSAAEDDVMW